MVDASSVHPCEDARHTVPFCLHDKVLAGLLFSLVRLQDHLTRQERPESRASVLPLPGLGLLFAGLELSYDLVLLRRGKLCSFSNTDIVPRALIHSIGSPA